MPNTLKALHIIGITLFLGSILGHVITSMAFSTSAFGAPSVTNQILVRQLIVNATKFMTIPGLMVLLLSGLYLLFKSKVSLKKRRWLIVHLAIAALIFLNAFFVLIPTGQVLLAEVSKNSPNISVIEKLAGREAIFGAINIIMAFITIFLATLKPKLGE